MAAIDLRHHNDATPQMRQTAAAQALATLRQLGREDLIQMLWIDWSSDFTSRMGDAMYAKKTDRVRRCFEQYRDDDGNIVTIRFSIPLWHRASEEERRETVIHEVCHLVTNHEAHLEGRKVKKSHGPEWKATMLRAGVNPKRCHNVQASGLGQKKIPCTCGCGDHFLTPLKAGRILLGTATYSCRICKEQILVDGERITQGQINECKRKANAQVAKKVLRRGLFR